MTRSPEPLLLREQSKNIVSLTLNRPAVLNALNRPLLLTLKQELEKIKDDPGIQAVVILVLETGHFQREQTLNI